jgi:hypothetical protein
MPCSQSHQRGVTFGYVWHHCAFRIMTGKPIGSQSCATGIPQNQQSRESLPVPTLNVLSSVAQRCRNETEEFGEVNLPAVHCVVRKSAASLRMLAACVRSVLVGIDGAPDDALGCLLDAPEPYLPLPGAAASPARIRTSKVSPPAGSFPTSARHQQSAWLFVKVLAGFVLYPSRLFSCHFQSIDWLMDCEVVAASLLDQELETPKLLLCLGKAMGFSFP